MSSELIHITKFDLCTKEQFENLGFVFVEKVILSDGRGAWQALLPEGWVMCRKDSWQTHIYDQLNRDRAVYADNQIEPNDQNRGSITLRRRYYSTMVSGPLLYTDYENYCVKVKRIVTSEEDAEVLYRTRTVNLRELKFPESNNTALALIKEADDWLDKHYPDWRDPLAYWDEE